MIFFSILSSLFLPIIIIGFFLSFVWRRKKIVHPATDNEWYLQIILSKEDAVSQFFLLLSILFLGVTLLAFNKDLGDPFSWQTILFITSVLSLISTYYLKTLYSLIFGLIAITAWWVAQATEWTQDKDITLSAIFVGSAFVGLLFYSLGHLHEREMKWKRFSFVYLFFGIILITSALFFLSSRTGLSFFEEMTKGVSFFSSWQITLSLFILLVFILGVSLYIVTKKLVSSFEFLAILSLTFLFGVIALLPQQSIFFQAGDFYNSYSGGKQLSGSGVLWAIIFNLVIFFELLGLIFSGYLRRETWLINLGAILLSLLIIVKYADWFFTFLGKSIFFIGAGILLFVVGWFMEKGRRVMISNIKEQTQTQQISQ